MSKKKQRRIDSEQVRIFEVAKDQLKGFYDEFVKLSNKKPDGAVNKFKLLHLNNVIKTANGLLGTDYIPFEEFTEFDEDTLPSNSDVVMMLAQYLSQMDRFKKDHSFYQSHSLTWFTELYNDDGYLLREEEDDDEEEDDEEEDEEEDD